MFIVGPYHHTILLVEDDESYAYVIKKAFLQNGVTGPIHCVSSGAEAIRYLMGEGKYADRSAFSFPSFLITDLQMKDQDGFAVLQHIKSNPDWAIIPTVVFSTSAEPKDVARAYVLGASSYHQKSAGYETVRQQLKILHDYWMTCLVPEVDDSGRRLISHDEGASARVAQKRYQSGS